MSTPRDPEQHGQTVEETAHETADDLLSRAFVSEQRTAVTHEVSTAGAVLVAAHAITAKLDAMESTHLEAMRDLQESIDSMAASLDSVGTHPEGDTPRPMPTAHESAVIYRALEEDYLQSNKAESIDQMDAMLRRFKRLAGC